MKDKEFKKSSFYVWFLGAQEDQYARDPGFVRSSIHHFLEKEKLSEPAKVTLQLNAKGLKVIQHVMGCVSGSRCDVLKIFLPCGTIKYIIQEEYPNDDVVSCVQLVGERVMFMRVSSYRCDSAATALILRGKLEALLRISEHLAASQDRQNCPKERSGNRSVRDSLSSSSSSQNEFIGKNHSALGLCDSLARELKTKLERSRTIGEPLLLPPKDYDPPSHPRSVNAANESRREENQTHLECTITKRSSSAKSSGIGSDETSSPIHEKLSSIDLKEKKSADKHKHEPTHVHALNQHVLTFIDSEFDNQVSVTPPRRPAESRQRSPSTVKSEGLPRISLERAAKPPPNVLRRAESDFNNSSVSSPPGVTHGRKDSAGEKSPNRKQKLTTCQWFRHELLNRFSGVKQIKTKEHERLNQCTYTELKASERYPGLDRCGARLHYHSMLQLPEPKVTPLFERHDLPPRLARNSYAEPSPRTLLLRLGRE